MVTRSGCAAPGPVSSAAMPRAIWSSPRRTARARTSPLSVSSTRRVSAAEQPRLEPRLELAHAMADRRLRDLDLLGRAGEAEVAGSGLERAAARRAAAGADA